MDEKNRIEKMVEDPKQKIQRKVVLLYWVSTGKTGRLMSQAKSCQTIRVVSAPRPRSRQHVARDHHALDLVRSLVDLHQLGVAHVPFHRVLFAVAAQDAHLVAGEL